MKTKLCECGCGQPTNIITKSNTCDKRIKGQFARFVRGHQHRGHQAVKRFGFIDDKGVGHIPLTQRQEALCDGNYWFHYLSQFNWCARREPWSGHWYAMRNVRLPNGEWKTQLMHRVIMRAPEGMEVDHIRREATLDNTTSNLRLTANQNPQNMGLRKDNTSGQKGVSFFKRTHAWRAAIAANGKNTHLGYFRTVVEAAAVWNWAARKFHKDFAFQNDLTQVTEADLKGFQR